MKLTTIWLNRVEGIGLILILFSFFVQIFQNNSEESFRESQNYHINKKLDHIWTLIENKYAEEEKAKPSKTETSFGKDEKTRDNKKLKPLIQLKPLDHDWELYSVQAKEMQVWESKIELFADISTWIFVVGTILVIVPKFAREKNE